MKPESEGYIEPSDYEQHLVDTILQELNVEVIPEVPEDFDLTVNLGAQQQMLTCASITSEKGYTNI